MGYTSWSVVFGEQPSASKWNILGTNDASFNDGTGFNDGIVLPKHLVSGTGSSWAFQSWTPTFSSGLTAGNGTHSSKYLQIGKLVFARMAFTLGSTSSVAAAAMIFSLPVTSVAYADGSRMGTGIMRDTGTNEYPAFSDYLSTTTVTFYAELVSGTYNAAGSTNSTTPFTWATGDHISCQLMYEAP